MTWIAYLHVLRVSSSISKNVKIHAVPMSDTELVNKIVIINGVTPTVNATLKLFCFDFLAHDVTLVGSLGNYAG